VLLVWAVACLPVDELALAIAMLHMLIWLAGSLAGWLVCLLLVWPLACQLAWLLAEHARAAHHEPAHAIPYATL
jgi:hypothetical protein